MVQFGPPIGPPICMQIDQIYYRRMLRADFFHYRRLCAPRHKGHSNGRRGRRLSVFGFDRPDYRNPFRLVN